MLLNDEDIQERLESPLNLLNRLRNATTPSNIPSLPPTSDDLKLDIPGKVAQGKLKETAAKIMALSLQELQVRISEVSNPDKLARIAVEMNKVVISREDDDKPKAAQIIVYAPQVFQANHFSEQFKELILENDQP